MSSAAVSVDANLRTSVSSSPAAAPFLSNGEVTLAGIEPAHPSIA
jgi:hypothetical protein